MLTTTPRIAAGAVVLAVACLADGRARHPGSPAWMTIASAQSPAGSARTEAADNRALLNKYCIGCHNQKTKTGNLALDTIDTGKVSANAEIWEKVARKLRGGLMPPVGMPKPDKAAVAAFVSSIETTIDRDATAAPDPGRPAVHRLNRAEYANAIRDLLDLEIDSKGLLPGDDAGYGFDNIGDVLTMSPGLLDRYMAASRKIARLALGDPSTRAVVDTVVRLPMMQLQDDRADGLPFGSRGGATARYAFPLDGEYVLRVNLQRGEMSGQIRGRGEDNQIDLRFDGVRVRLFSGPRRPAAGAAAPPDEPLEVRVPVKGGTHEIGVALLKRSTVPEGVGPSRMPPGSTSYTQVDETSTENGRIQMSIDSVDILGPYEGAPPQDTATRRRLFVCRPARPSEESGCARTILSSLARRAYRRPTTADDVQALMAFYQAGRGEGGFDAGIQFALERLLVAPDFLFRIEQDPRGAVPGSAHRISDLELASRLSFFLWSTIPDDELLTLAERGRLKDPAVLEQQVRRMMRDGKAKASWDNFFGQWLMLRNVAVVTPDIHVFPEFDENLRDAFATETELFLDEQLREDRPITELFTANYTYLNERLARHYQVPHVYGSHFRRVTLPDDRRAGLFGQGSILTVTALANRTSPVYRGKFLLQNILGTPPPPPPPNVPPFPENQGGVPKSVRAIMEQHRKNPVCATCHSKLDPLGFALENFDAIGRWRTMDGATTVDASGSMPDGTPFNGPAEFRIGLLQQRDAIVETVAERLLTYAMGRGAEYYDMPAIRAITRATAKRDDRWSALVVGVVNSLPFQMRRSPS